MVNISLIVYSIYIFLFFRKLNSYFICDAGRELEGGEVHHPSVGGEGPGAGDQHIRPHLPHHGGSGRYTGIRQAVIQVGQAVIQVGQAVIQVRHAVEQVGLAVLQVRQAVIQVGQAGIQEGPAVIQVG